ncbi:MAG: insulinase family protein [Dictyoglomus sp.]|nr:insulinase family protein [Dictyoglomus sp.]MCX7941904.1 insulinase family protein [Dictyoglomaceae bacterium]MDW8188595.1 pitrilysin family protein [Dictyoglomus sp.]
MNPQILILDNNLKLVFETTPYRKSVDIIIAVNSGSRYEKQNEHGLAHLVEHLLFKNNYRKNKNIALEIDRLGGELDAFTTREGTYFILKILKAHLSRGLNLLSEIILNPEFTAEDLEIEKKVVKEEVKMYWDSPEEIALDLFLKSSWDGHPIAREILGTEESIESFNLEKVMDFYKRLYNLNNMTILVSGDLSFKTICDMVEKNFYKEVENTYYEELSSPIFKPNKLIKEENFEQIQFFLGTESYKPQDERKFSLYLLSLILGGGISSRLFQELREKNGLVYNVETQGISFKDTSLFAIYTATTPRFFEKTLITLVDQIEKIKKEGITKEELDTAKKQSIYNFLMQIENPRFRLFYYFDSLSIYGEIISPYETIRKIRRVSLEDVHNTIEYIFNKPFSLSLVGPVNSKIKKLITRGDLL